MIMSRNSIVYIIDFKCNSGHSSVVERNLAKVDVARSNRVARSLKIKVNFYAPIV